MNDEMNGAASAHDPEDPGDGPGNNSRFGIRRPRTRAEERIAGLDSSAATLAAEAAAARERTAVLETELDEERAARLRAVADYQNLRRRTEQERAEIVALAGETVIRRLLGIVDDVERAVALAPAAHDPAVSAWIGGVAAIERKLAGLLAAEGVTPIAAAGLPFDPQRHEAIIHEQTTTVPDGHVVRELQRGYEISGRVIRPALVAVADNATPTGDA
ncbi:MAG: nucleotide exchange factor GrpE [Chloroflexota bacterium]